MTKTIGILQPSYLPWVGFFEQIHRADVFVYYDDTQFEKGSWRNRNRIKTAAGVQWLTVPVLTTGKAGQSILDVRINTGQPWQRKHIRSITQSYSKAPHYEDYAEGLFEIIDRPWEFLVDLNLALTEWFCDCLGIVTPRVRSSELGLVGGGGEKLIRMIKHFGADTFYEGSAGRNYINTDDFLAEGINVVFQDYRHPSYAQMHGEFVAFLSIVDLLFNAGEDSLQILCGEKT